MKKLLLLSILISGYASSQEFEFNIPMQDKPHQVIKFSAEQGKIYNWDRCSGYNYNCPSGWNLSGSTCSRFTTQSPIDYK